MSISQTKGETMSFSNQEAYEQYVHSPLKDVAFKPIERWSSENYSHSTFTRNPSKGRVGVEITFSPNSSENRSIKTIEIMHSDIAYSISLFRNGTKKYYRESTRWGIKLSQIKREDIPSFI